MRLPRDVSGNRLVQLLERHCGYRAVRTRGSHIRVVCTRGGEHGGMARGMAKGRAAGVAAGLATGQARAAAQAARHRFGPEAAKALAALVNGLTERTGALVMAAVVESATAEEMLDRVGAAVG